MNVTGVTKIIPLSLLVLCQLKNITFKFRTNGNVWLQWLKFMKITQFSRIEIIWSSLPENLMP